MIIYKITNSINGKTYIGQTICSLSDRKSGHLADSKRNRKERVKSKISRAIFKYGIENFIFEIIEETNSIDELNILEQKYIKELNSNIDSIGYNLLSGGRQNGKHSEETKKKISENSKHLKPWLGKHHSEESNKKRSDTIKGVPCPQRTHTYSDEQKKIISERMKKIRSEKSWSTKKKETITSV
jgi:group I intron endonuclease